MERNQKILSRGLCGNAGDNVLVIAGVSGENRFIISLGNSGTSLQKSSGIGEILTVDPALERDSKDMSAVCVSGTMTDFRIGKTLGK